jgi:Sporulation and spore germination
VRRSRGAVLATVAGCSALVCAACGLPSDGTVHPIEPSAVPYALLSPAPQEPAHEAGPNTASPELYLVDRSDLLVPFPTTVAAGSTSTVARQVLDQLDDGPTESARRSGLGSALGPDASLSLTDVSGGTATVEVSLPAGDPAPSRLPLAVGQIVLSLTSVPGVELVQLRQDDTLVEVALPGGARTSEPVGAGDYRALLASANASS